jgi:diguanylate cyclase (GGDEF)-like protein/PAS domain S-box-containing protein
MVDDSKDDALLVVRRLQRAGNEVASTHIDTADTLRCVLSPVENIPGIARAVDDECRTINVSPSAARVLLSDLTERKQTEKTLHLLQRAIESSSNGIAIVDATQPKYPIIYVNPAFESITGYSAGEVLGQNPASLFGRDGQQPEFDKIRLGFKEQRERRAVLQSHRKDGSVFWIELAIAPVRTGAGEPAYYVGILNDISDRKSYERQLEYQSNYDPLTGLPNRNLLRDRIDQAVALAVRNGSPVGVLYLDVDNFQYINDSFGHTVGDSVLKAFAERLVNCVRASDTVARYGGDEFVLVLPGLDHKLNVASIAQSVLERLRSPFEFDGQKLFLSGSIGVSVYPKDGGDSEVLLRNAAAAMYRAKQRERGSYKFYTAEFNRSASRRLTLESQLRHAIENDELVLHYQPQIDLETGQILGAEALLRWRHPTRGLLNPGSFIPLAEETGLIDPLGDWVLRAACAQGKAWRQKALHLRLAVNVSSRQFRRNRLFEKVAHALDTNGLEGRHLDLEITESLMMHDTDASIAVLKKIKTLGVGISVDDFGTGYSSLSYLKRFPIDTLKVDRSFVQGVTTSADDAAIVRAIIAMAHNLRLQVLAEGVETEGQLRFLRRQKCNGVQGFLISLPLPADDFFDFVCRNRRFDLGQQLTESEERALLIVDDEANVRSALSRLLRGRGYRVLTADSGKAGLDLLAVHDVQVIVADYRMPEMTGVEFLSRVKDLYPETVRIVLSGVRDIQAVTDAVNEGAIYKFLLKPWNDDALCSIIREAFDRFCK